MYTYVYIYIYMNVNMCIYVLTVHIYPSRPMYFGHDVPI